MLILDLPTNLTKLKKKEYFFLLSSMFPDNDFNKTSTGSAGNGRRGHAGGGRRRGARGGGGGAGGGAGRGGLDADDVGAARAHRAHQERRALERQFQRVHPALAGAQRRHAEDQVRRRQRLDRRRCNQPPTTHSVSFKPVESMKSRSVLKREPGIFN